jgi:predicted O-methyltransferase YrrM
MNFEAAYEKMSKVDGWMDEPDLLWLFNTSLSLNKNATVVEIGSWKGRSACISLLGLQSNDKIENPASRFFCIDKWLGNTGDYEPGYDGAGIAAYNEFIFNLKNVCNTVPFIIRADSAKSACLFEDDSVDFVFIDANHVADDVERDVRSWLPKVKSDGILSGHDWAKDGGEIPRALSRIMHTNTLNKTECSIWWARKNEIKFH